MTKKYVRKQTDNADKGTVSKNAIAECYEGVLKDLWNLFILVSFLLCLQTKWIFLDLSEYYLSLKMAQTDNSLAKDSKEKLIPSWNYQKQHDSTLTCISQELSE